MGLPRRVTRCILLISLLLAVISSSAYAAPSESRGLRRRLGEQDGKEENAENKDANNNMDAQEENNEMEQNNEEEEDNNVEEAEEGDDEEEEGEEVEEGDDGADEDEEEEGDDAVADDDAVEEGDDDSTDDTDDSQGDDATQTDDNVSQGDDNSQNSNSYQGESGTYLWARDDDDDVFKNDDASYWRSNQNLKAQGNFDSSYLGQYRSSYSNNANTYNGDASSQLYEDDDYEYYYDDDDNANIDWQKKSSGLGLLNLGDNLGMAVFLFCTMFLVLACCMFGRYFARKCYKLVRGKRRRRKANNDLGKSLADDAGHV